MACMSFDNIQLKLLNPPRKVFDYFSSFYVNGDKIMKSVLRQTKPDLHLQKSFIEYFGMNCHAYSPFSTSSFDHVMKGDSLVDWFSK